MIQIKNLIKSYDGKNRVVDGMDLNINAGEIIVLIGKSGCGKSTTLRMLNRLIEPTSGDIFINGVSIFEQDPIQLRRKIGYVIQKVGLLPHMTVGQNIELIPQLEKWSPEERRERANELLDMVDLPSREYYNRYPSELSGGQQQRVGFARALAVNPDIILMDEPFSALDPITREQLQLEILKLQDELKKTIVFVTHDIDEAIKVGDRIAVLKDGKIIQCDTPEEILKNPVNDYVEEFVGSNRLWQSPEFLFAKDLMLTDVTTLGMQRSTAQAIEHMRSKKTNTAFIVGDTDTAKNKLLGQVSMKQFSKINDNNLKMKDLLDDDVQFVYENQIMVEVLNKMQELNYTFIPVVNKKQELRGVITQSSLLNVINEVIPEVTHAI